MRFSDIIVVALRNLSAGKPMVRKMIVSTSVIMILMIGFAIISYSYFCYQDDFNMNHATDCYYYTEFEDRPLTDMGDIFLKSGERKNRYKAADLLLLASVQMNDNPYMAAQDTTISFDGTEHAAHYGSFWDSYEIYQNIQWKTSNISLGFFDGNSKLFTDKMIRHYGDSYLLGRYPDNPGEIMMDTYILSIFGIEEIDDRIIGSKITIKSLIDGTEETVIDDYILTGVFKSELFAVRESKDALDTHLEHIYVHFNREDLSGFQIQFGSARYYFDNYSDYAENCEFAKKIFFYDLEELLADSDDYAKLTPKGLEYLLIYWVIENIGKLLMIVAVAICFVVTFSLLYVLNFYCDRNASYIKMLHDIGMTKKNRLSILVVELSITVAASTVVSLYFSALFLILLNVVTKAAVGFPISFNILVCLLAIGLSWLFFALCFALSISKTERRNS